MPETMAELDRRLAEAELASTNRQALVDQVLGVLRGHEMEPVFDVRDLITLTEYIRTGHVPPRDLDMPVTMEGKPAL